MANRDPNHATRFKSGRAWKGNPGGKFKHGDIRDQARLHSPEAIMALVRGLSDPRQYVNAALAILDRAMGRPRQEVAATVRQIGGTDAPAGAPETPEQIEEWLERRRRELAALKRPN